MLRICSVLTSAVMILASSAVAQNVQADASARLALQNGKTHYRSGEPIVLQITLKTSSTNCFEVDGTSARTRDTIELTPARGAFQWANTGGRAGDSEGWGILTPNQPATMQLTLNDLYRFDASGIYTVVVRTGRMDCGTPQASKPVELATNPVSFYVEQYEPADEKQLAQRLGREIEVSDDQRLKDKLVKQLDYLPGDNATRVKLSLLLHEKTFYPLGYELMKGLAIARDRAMVINALQNAIADPKTEIDLASALIPELQDLNGKPRQPAESTADTPTRQYVHRLALSLPRSTGRREMQAAQKVFETDGWALAYDPSVKPDFELAREIVIANFGQLSMSEAAAVIGRNGTYLDDPRILPALASLMGNPKGTFNGDRLRVLQQMKLIAPEQVDPWLVQEACEQQPVSMQDARDLSATETLPAVDACLGERLRTLLAGPIASYPAARLDATLEYIARYADAALVPEVRKTYLARQAGDARWSQDGRGAALCYLMRWDAAQTTPLLLQIMPGHAGADEFVLMSIVKSAMPSAAGLRKVLRQQIELDPAAARTIVYALSQIGTAEDREFLLARLSAFHQRHGYTYSSSDGRTETEFVDALIRGRTWDFSGDEGRRIAQEECRSVECLASFQISPALSQDGGPAKLAQ